ncbi:hypothetical protein QJS04_geneDACA000991 [Acorus gramineus]|uniref:H(+)-transporting two-sector ATPase n=1 Tax=Acorus gramineus TaxID=55184 RepID=A0AAV9AC91_ACOGR|nr:hypothetical protein QJS04_geneDACA000991 [Acorus gramineus]
MLQPRIIGEEHYEIVQRVKQTLQRCKELQDIIAILGLDELSEGNKFHLSSSSRRPLERWKACVCATNITSCLAVDRDGSGIVSIGYPIRPSCN